MQKYSASGLKNAIGQMLEHALFGPVTITKHGQDKYVVLNKEAFHRLCEAAERSGSSAEALLSPARPSLRETAGELNSQMEKRIGAA